MKKKECFFHSQVNTFYDLGIYFVSRILTTVVTKALGPKLCMMRRKLTIKNQGICLDRMWKNNSVCYRVSNRKIYIHVRRAGKRQKEEESEKERKRSDIPAFY